MNAKDKLILWLVGSGCTQERIDTILSEQRMVWELAQTSADAEGIRQNLPYELRPKDSMERLQFMRLF